VLTCAGEHELGPGTVLHRRRMHHHVQQQPEGVDEQVAFAAADAFARVVADLLTTLAGLRALGVQHRGRGLRVAPVDDPHLITQNLVHPVPGAVGGPGPKPLVGDAPRRQIVRNQPPRAPTDQHITDRVDDQPPRVDVRTPTQLRRGPGQQRLDHRPLPVGHRRLIGLTARTRAHPTG